MQLKVTDYHSQITIDKLASINSHPATDRSQLTTDQPTRVTDHSSTIIDNIFSNASDSGESVSGNITTNISDHFIQFMFIKKYHISYKACNYFIHDYSKFGKEKFIHDFSLLDWSLLDESNKSVNEKFDYFYSAVSSCINGHAPKKKLSKKDLKLRSKPWINSKIKKLMYLRDRMFNKANKDPTPDNKYLYRKFRNRIVAEQRETKIIYFKDYFEKYKTNMKMLRSGIRSLVNIKNRGNLSHISNLMINSSRVQDPTKMANAFNRYFVNVGTNVDKSIPRTKKSPFDYLKERNPNSFFLAPVTPREIEIIINSFNKNKSTGPYSIPILLLKILSSYISIPLASLVHSSFETGIFPEKLKLGKVNPLHKKESTEVPSNYRPISVLSVFSKIIEKLMHTHLYNFLDTFEMLYPLQFGFREKHSTMHALLSLTESIKQSIDNGKFDCGIFIDLQKAFDTVNHKILPGKLEHYGIRGTTLNWFHSYLTGCQQYVTVNGHISDSLTINCGVPQGCVLGPLLFLTYMNDLPNVSKVLCFYLFADGTSIYFDSTDLITLQKVVNRELRGVRKWLEANRLALNISKTNYVIFHSHSKKVSEFIRIKLGRKTINRVNYIKYLGVLVDSTLSWKPHVTELAKKLSRNCAIFFKLRHYVNPETLKLLYFSLFHSFISYGSSIWGLTHPSILDPLFKLQKKVIWAITFQDRFAHTTPLFSQLGLLKLFDIHLLQLLSFIYDCMKGHPLAYFSNFFIPVHSIHQYHTRQASKGDIFLHSVNTTQFGIRSARYTGAILWNKLPILIRESPSKTVFKKKLQKWYLESYSSFEIE